MNEVKRYRDTDIFNAAYSGDDEGLPEDFVGVADYDTLKKACVRWWEQARLNAFLNRLNADLAKTKQKAIGIELAARKDMVDTLGVQLDEAVKLLRQVDEEAEVGPDIGYAIMDFLNRIEE
jgi:hypothetical protein